MHFRRINQIVGLYVEVEVELARVEVVVGSRSSSTSSRTKDNLVGPLILTWMATAFGIQISYTNHKTKLLDHFD